MKLTSQRRKKGRKTKGLELIIITAVVFASQYAFSTLADANSALRKWEYIPNAYAVFNSINGVYNATATPKTIIETSDLDSDGINDILLATRLPKHNLNDQLIYSRAEYSAISGKTGELLWQSFFLGETADIHAVEDIDGDGKKDIAAYTYTANNSFKVLRIRSGVNGQYIFDDIVDTPDLADHDNKSLLNMHIDRERIKDLVIIEEGKVSAFSIF